MTNDLQIASVPSENKFKNALRIAFLGTKRFGERLVAHPLSYLFFAFLLPAGILFLLYAARGVYPFGTGSVLVLDLNGQYVYFFEKLRNILRGDGTILYAWERALGGEFIGMFAYYVASPFSLLIALFPDGHITESLFLIFVLKCGACGATFAYYLHKTFPTRDKLSVILFSAMYALSSYAIVYQNNTMWIDHLVYLPLLIYGIDELIAKGKCKLYAVTLALSLFANFYIGYMMCIFTLIYFFYRYATTTGGERNFYGEKRHFVRSLVRIGIFSVVAILIATIIIAPTLYSLSFGKNEFQTNKYEWYQKFDWLDMLAKFFAGSYDTVRPEGLPLLYCGILTLFLVPLYFLCPKIPARERVGGGALLAILLSCFGMSNLDILWHGMQRPNWLNYRYSFMFVFFLVLFAFRVFRHIRDFRFSQAATIGAVLAFVLVILQNEDYEYLGDFSFFYLNFALLALYIPLLAAVIRNSIPKYGPALLVAIATFGAQAFLLYYFVGFAAITNILVCALLALLAAGILAALVLALPPYLASGGVIVQLLVTLLLYKWEIVTRDYIFATIAIMLLYLLVWLVRHPLTRMQSSTLMLTVLVSLELFGNAALDLNALDKDVVFSSRTSYEDYMDRLRPIVSDLKAYDDSFYRAEKTLHRTVNDNMTLGLRGISNSTSTLNASVIKLLNRMGYASTSHWSKYAGGTVVSDALLGIKYVIRTEKTDSPYYKLVLEDAENELYVYENLYAMSVAAAVSPKFGELEFTNENGTTNNKEHYPSAFELMNAMVSAMVGRNTKIWNSCYVTSPSSYQNAKEGRQNFGDYFEYVKIDSSQPATVIYTFDAPVLQKGGGSEPVEVFMFIPSEFLRGATLKVNGKNLGYYHTHDTDHVVSLGHFAQGEEINVRLTMQDDKFFFYKGSSYFYYLDSSALTRFMTQLQSQSMDITNFTDTMLEGTISVGETNTHLYTSIPYDAGWHVYVDGEEIETYKTAECLLGADLTTGEHAIKFVYRSDAYVLGVLATATGLVLFAGLIVLDIFLVRRRRAAWAKNNVLFTATSNQPVFDADTDTETDTEDAINERSDTTTDAVLIETSADAEAQLAELLAREAEATEDVADASTEDTKADPPKVTRPAIKKVPKRKNTYGKKKK